MTIFLTFFFFFLIIGFLVFIHELGHFMAAKFTGVAVQSFALGFGPKIIAHTYKGTEYRINLFPLGGYVQMEGEHSEQVKGGFRDSKFWVKFVILIGGVFMNIVGAIILLGIQLKISNNVVTIPNYSDFEFHNAVSQYSYYPVFLSEVEEEYGWEGEFENAIVEINGQSFTNVFEFEDLVDQNRNREVNIKSINASSDKLSLENTTLQFGGLYKDKYLPFEVTEVIEGSNSEGNIKVGELLVGANGKYFTSQKSFNDFLKTEINLDSENTFIFLDKKTDKEYSKTFFIKSQEEDKPLLGIKYNLQSGYAVSISEISQNFYFIEYQDNLASPFAFSYDMTLYQMKSLGNIFSDAFSTGDFSQVSENFGGPVKVGNVVNEAVEYDAIKQLFGIAGLISLSLAIFNILPIPALDGGQIAIAAVESIRRKRLSDSVINAINASGFFVLIGLSILIFVKDVVELDLIGNVWDGMKGALGK